MCPCDSLIKINMLMMQVILSPFSLMKQRWSSHESLKSLREKRAGDYKSRPASPSFLGPVGLSLSWFPLQPKIASLSLLEQQD